jgi:hypothetical protein
VVVPRKRQPAVVVKEVVLRKSYPPLKCPAQMVDIAVLATNSKGRMAALLHKP